MPLVGTLTLIAVGCGASGNASPTLEQIVPNRGYSDAPIPVKLVGESFHPPILVDTYSSSADLAPSPFQISLDPLRPTAGRRSVAAVNPSWISQGEIDAILPAGLLAGTYSVALRDAAGNTISSSATYTSLGPDIDPPHITFLQPPAGTTFAANDQVTVQVHVDDGAGQLGTVQWSTDPPQESSPATCDPDANGLCEFVIIIPAGIHVVDPIEIRVDAADNLHNQATGYRRVQVAKKPVIGSMVPLEGSTVGGTSITVFAQNLYPNLSQITFDGISVGGRVAQDGSIMASTPTHIPGSAMVSVINSDSVSDSVQFTFIPPPILKLIDPAHAVVNGPTVTIHLSGDNFRPETVFSWVQGATTTLISYAPTSYVTPVPPYERLTSPTRVDLTLPTDRTGTFSIVAHDPVSSDSELVDAFTLDPAPAP